MRREFKVPRYDIVGRRCGEWVMGESVMLRWVDGERVMVSMRSGFGTLDDRDGDSVAFARLNAIFVA